MEVAVCFFILSIFSANNVRGQDGCKQIDFLPCETDKHLQGHVIKKIVMRVDDATLPNCKHQCYVERHFVSYNLSPIRGDKRVCELQDTDHVGDPNDVKSLTGAEYCPVKNPCASSPCHSYQICRPDFYLGTFKCFNNTCAGLKDSGKGTQNGVFTITPVPGFNLQVYCDQETDGGGWTVIQKRFDGSVDFYRGWDDYKRGFGNKNAEYWLGLDVIHNLTNIARNELRVDLKDVEGTGAHAMYGEFRVESESEKYRLFLGNFKGGDAGDSFSYHNSMFFTTFDSDNEDFSTINCAVTFKGAWWYHTCHTSNLNGRYLNGTHRSHADGINWKTWKGFQYSAKEVEMKIRPMGFGSK